MAFVGTTGNRTSRTPQGDPGTKRVLIRDVQKAHHERELPGTTPVLFVPYDLFECQGPCVAREDGTVMYRHRSGQHLARVRPGLLGDCHPGQRVLVQFDTDPPHEGEWWWLVEITAVNGDDANE